MYETLLRPQDVNQIPSLQHISEVSEKLKQAEQKREEKRLRQIAAGRSKGGDVHGAKRKRDGDAEQELTEADDMSIKRVKTVDEDSGAPQDNDTRSLLPQEIDFLKDPVGSSQLTPSPVPAAKINVSKALSEVRGHTSYLTFACLLPMTSPPEDVTDVSDMSNV